LPSTNILAAVATSDTALLINAPVGRHFAQFYRTPQERLRSLGLFVETGLRRGNAVILIATPGDSETLLERLATMNLCPVDRLKSGQLVILDSQATLNEFMVRDMPDWSRFRKTIGRALEDAHSVERGSIRAYGDMVNILWNAGRVDAAIRLEEYWNELARIYPFSLFCGYTLDTQHESGYQGPLNEIARTHGDIISSDEDERFGMALEAACRDVFGRSFADLVSLSGREDSVGESRLPAAHRTMLWILRKRPDSSAMVLARARVHLGESRMAGSGRVVGT
jgi:hypothetical protein